ncbi:hypothetical protein [Massilia horti]|uniref:hypothetical protein n=1 Tax=Massilia horti TaxID=2562153 RepID=UPI00142F74D8|nr:hypothetical protein [Massilia horti]
MNTKTTLRGNGRQHEHLTAKPRKLARKAIERGRHFRRRLAAAFAVGMGLALVLAALD